MTFRLASVLAVALCASVVPAHAQYSGSSCRGIAPIQPTCTTGFVASSSDMQVSHFRIVGRLTIVISGPSGTWRISCGEVPSPAAPDCDDDITGGFLKGQAISVRATSAGVGEYRVEVYTP